MVSAMSRQMLLDNGVDLSEIELRYGREDNVLLELMAGKVYAAAVIDVMLNQLAPAMRKQLSIIYTGELEEVNGGVFLCAPSLSEALCARAEKALWHFFDLPAGQKWVTEVAPSGFYPPTESYWDQVSVYTDEIRRQLDYYSRTGVGSGF